jgi:ABC-type transport system involved in multi-copper enzyme maturation permease subunit
MQRLITALAGPVFAKEMIELARGRRHYLLRVIYGLALLGGVSIAWLALYGAWHGAADSINQQARMGEYVFRVLSLIQLGAIVGLAPIFLSGAIAGEREEGKLDPLLMTSLSNREIVVGKLMSRSLNLMLLILMATPFLALFVLFGGVEPAALLRVSLANMALLLFTGSECLYLSVRSHSVAGCLIRAYWRLVLLLCALPAIALTVDNKLAHSTISTTQFDIKLLVAVLNPATSFLLAVDGFAYTRYDPFVFAGALALPCLWAMLRIAQSIYLLRQPPEPASRIVRRTALAIRDWLFGHTNLEKTRLKRESPSTGRRVSNPLWQRARWCRVYDPHHYVRLTQIAVAVTMLLFVRLLIRADRHAYLEGYATPSLATVWSILLLMTAVQAASSIIGDKKRGFFDLVLATPLSGRTIVDGVFGAIWEHVRWFYILPIYFNCLFSLSGYHSFIGFISMALVGTLLCILLMTVGLSFSLAARTRAGALTAIATFIAVIECAVPALEAAFQSAAQVAGIAILGTIGGLIWYRLRPGLTSMCLLFSAAHSLFLVLAQASFWSGASNDAIILPPATAPLEILILPIMNEIAVWGLPVLLYTLALIVSVWLGRWWIIEHFDQLAERIPAGDSSESSPTVAEDNVGPFSNPHTWRVTGDDLRQDGAIVKSSIHRH